MYGGDLDQRPFPDALIFKNEKSPPEKRGLFGAVFPADKM